ncbi:unnamed protein product [Vitrella brassicaformis CCMP3155]|uniref:ABM domain-containing protein n=1 Tax=Vitrella brassicaformis (strain CCMP3155) TaxID=1169540 RepID=A0A0G4GEP9_VITBC|nr:unnamed protein product [Vitrella brassicaformis CCMP3155]|eukprot:CEM27836.1 unnamed protein product [Vitrella brassicaformis CCMP3155]
MDAAEPVAAAAMAVDGSLLPSFVACTSFPVMKGCEAAFEQRWLEAEERAPIASIKDFAGFIQFFLLKGQYDEVNDATEYVSMSVWRDREAFEAFPKSDYFKLRHAADSSLPPSTHAAGPSVSIYEAVLYEPRAGMTIEQLKEGAFIATNRFAVAAGSQDAFETRWRTRDRNLPSFPAFRKFMLLRRVPLPPDMGVPSNSPHPACIQPDVTHISFTEWQSEAGFDEWRNSQSFAKTHSAAEDAQPKGPPKGPVSGELRGPPKPTFFSVVLTEAN